MNAKIHTLAGGEPGWDGRNLQVSPLVLLLVVHLVSHLPESDLASASKRAATGKEEEEEEEEEPVRRQALKKR